MVDIEIDGKNQPKTIHKFDKWNNTDKQYVSFVFRNSYQVDSCLSRSRNSKFPKRKQFPSPRVFSDSVLHTRPLMCSFGI